MGKPKSKVEIPALAAGASNITKMSKECTIRAIEAKLKSLEQHDDDFEINRTADNVPPPIQKYQFNKNSDRNSDNNRYSTNRKYSSGPYNKHQRRHKR